MPSLVSSCTKTTCASALEVPLCVTSLNRLRRHIFLELATGGDLFSYMAKHRILCEGEAKYIAFQLMKGLEVTVCFGPMVRLAKEPSICTEERSLIGVGSLLNCLHRAYFSVDIKVCLAR